MMDHGWGYDMLKFLKGLSEKEREIVILRAVAANIYLEGHIEQSKKLFDKADKLEQDK
jgi:hypothetical protein